MNKTFELAITPNYTKEMWKLILMLIFVLLPVILFGIFLEKGLLDFKRVRFEVVFPVYFILVVVSSILVVRKTFFKDTVTLSDECIKIPKLRGIDFDEITKYKSWRIKGYTTYFITLKDGKNLPLDQEITYPAPLKWFLESS